MMNKKSKYIDVHGRVADLECQIQKYLTKENITRDVENTCQMQCDIEDVSVALADAISRLSNIFVEIGSLGLDDRSFDIKKALKKINKLFKDSDAGKFIKVNPGE